jgi:hypothetical protein
MEEARIEFARAAWRNFLRLEPSREDMQCVREELARLRDDPDAGEPVPFAQWQECCLTWSYDWRIIYKKDSSGIFVVHIDREMPSSSS